MHLSEFFKDYQLMSQEKPCVENILKPESYRIKALLKKTVERMTKFILKWYRQASVSGTGLGMS